MDMLDSIAHAIMKAADGAQKQSEPKYAIELFDLWLDCRELAQAAHDAFIDYCTEEQRREQKRLDDLAMEAEMDERF